MDSLTLEIRKNSPASSPWKNRQTGYPGTDAAHHSMYLPFLVFKPLPFAGKRNQSAPFMGSCKFPAW